MIIRSPRVFRQLLLASLLTLFAVALAGCGGPGTRLQPPTASVQQLTAQSDGTWVVVLRIQNYSYDTGMHVYSVDVNLSLDGQAAGHLTAAPSLDVPAMDADTVSLTLKPEAAGAAALAAAKRNAMRYTLKGTLSVGKGSKGKAQSFKLDGSGYISPVPGVSNIWR